MQSGLAPRSALQERYICQAWCITDEQKRHPREYCRGYRRQRKVCKVEFTRYPFVFGGYSGGRILIAPKTPATTSDSVKELARFLAREAVKRYLQDQKKQMNMKKVIQS